MFSLLFPMLLGACDELAPDDTTEPVLDEVAPTVVATDPTDGARGVRTDQLVTVTFSEPMDPTTTLSAVTASHAPEEVRLSGDGLVLTVALPLAYNQEPGETRTVDQAFEVAVSTDATDLAGNPLDAPALVRFRTATERVVELAPHDTLFGNRALSTTDRYTFLGGGDVTSGDVVESVVSWPIDVLPPLEAVLWVEEAVLETEVHQVIGTPGADFGALVVDRVQFATFGEGFTADAISRNPAPWLPDAAAYTEGAPVLVDLAPVLTEAWDEGDPLLQLRLSFEGAPSTDEGADLVYFRLGETRLTVTYLTF